MATSKYSLAEQSQRIILGGNVSNNREVAIQELMVYVGQAFASVVKTSLFQGFAEGERDINGGFIYSFDDVNILEDSNRKMFYSDLPATHIDLPNNIGLYHVSLMKDQADAFVQVPTNFLSLSRGLASGSLQGRIGYFAENNKIYYVNMTDKTCKVLIKLVAALDSIDDDAPLGIPADTQAEIIRRVVELYTLEQQNPKDLINDKIK